VQDAWQLSFQTQRLPVGQALGPHGSSQTGLLGDDADGQLLSHPTSPAASSRSPPNLDQLNGTLGRTAARPSRLPAALAPRTFGGYRSSMGHNSSDDSRMNKQSPHEGRGDDESWKTRPSTETTSDEGTNARVARERKVAENTPAPGDKRK